MEEAKVVGAYKMPEPTLSQKVDKLTQILEEGGPEKIKKPKKFKRTILKVT
jgi:hypothetical protein